MSYNIYHANCLNFLRDLGPYAFDMIFADPPDNIGLKYDEYDDSIPDTQYVELFEEWVRAFTSVTPVVWLSFNPKWTAHVGRIILDVLDDDWHFKPCVQTFTFGQHNHHDFGVNHRPLWRLARKGHPMYPDAVRVESERQKMGDKRADPRGRVPGDVFDFPRVTGNSKQRRKWHKTQLHEDLVERCVLAHTLPGDHVYDPFAGTGTTLRVCKKLDRCCTTTDVDLGYCANIAAEHELKVLTKI